MKEIERQVSLLDVSDEYREFVNKFKPKKTADDCYTPENVYNAVKGWACGEYGINPENVVRPFWPGADYERFEYKQESVVVDNPPFSILARIIDYYNAREIPYFLFAPHFTNFSSNNKANHIVCGCTITYENGAEVSTSFVTSFGEWFIDSATDLCEAIKKADKENKNKGGKLPKYEYPDNVLTAAMVGQLGENGIRFRLKKRDCHFIRELDSQKEKKKSIFGGDF